MIFLGAVQISVNLMDPLHFVPGKGVSLKNYPFFSLVTLHKMDCPCNHIVQYMNGSLFCLFFLLNSSALPNTESYVELLDCVTAWDR